MHRLSRVVDLFTYGVIALLVAAIAWVAHTRKISANLALPICAVTILSLLAATCIALGVVIHLEVVDQDKIKPRNLALEAFAYSVLFAAGLFIGYHMLRSHLIWG